MIEAVARETVELVSKLCQELNDATKLKKKGKCSKFTNIINNTQQEIDRWKFNDWDYGKSTVKLPINARGLFTIDDREIIIRGYDKFFNVDELELTKRQNLKNLSGPFDVTLKENGCIIFIGGMKNGELVVCSKNSTGDRKDLTKNHATEGEIQIYKQLAKINRTDRQLGQFLYDNNLTAVAELCDDEFEEHVLPYSKDVAGLYLHGLNYNTIIFKTVPIEEVNKFASEWGFKSIESLKFDDSDSLFQFLDDCAITGKYNNKEIEGFVIRCHNPDFFYKFKFEQPYLLYRQFREITKKLIADKIPIESIPIKKNKCISRKYLIFARDYFNKNPHFIERFNNGHGIIELREAFLAELNQKNGMSLLEIDDSLQKLLVSADVPAKYVIVSVATIGCGKTTVFNTLSQVFPEWVHIQNDDISSSSKLKIVDRTLKALNDHDVVLFDRNNSGIVEREQLFDDFFKKRDYYISEDTPVKFICLNFVHDVDDDELWNLTQSRVFARGDNHQSIKSEMDPQNATKVMKGFIGRFRPVNPKKLPDSQFDLIIDLELGPETSLPNTKLIIDTLNTNFPELINNKLPSESELETAFEKALQYKPTFQKKFIVSKSPAFFGVSVDKERIISLLNESLQQNTQWMQLQDSDRIQAEFHVTLGHVANSKGENKIKWKNLTKVFPVKIEDKSKAWLDFYGDIKILQVIIRRNQLICIKVDLLQVFDSNFEPINGVDPLNKYLHITIGTFDASIKPAQSNTVLTSLYSTCDSINLADGIYTHEDENEIDEIINLPNIVLEKQRIFAQC